ncbi:hypothetical protein D9757_014740 [Collybiopsis confluens]|uniref:WSC domain-containing protein n=1 Tax=Collybiopsis confluens TaxID=2823264 RepID=A0A8H5CGZ7_9AGAR|nr:hypothetical protein D9757_014740 [Collybiopsis confluens]
MNAIAITAFRIMLQQLLLPTVIPMCRKCKGSAANRLNVFNSGKTPPAPPTTVPKVGNWTSLGCYRFTILSFSAGSDGVNGQRTLTVQMNLASTTVETCTSAVSPLDMNLQERICGSAIINGGVPTPSPTATWSALGTPRNSVVDPTVSTQSALGADMYNYTGNNLPPIATGGGGGGGAPVFPVTSGLPTPWKYIACYVYVLSLHLLTSLRLDSIDFTASDGAHGRVFEFDEGGNPNNTVQECINLCASQNFSVAGMEFSDECYCGNRLVNGAVVAADSTCNMGCAGNETYGFDQA